MTAAKGLRALVEGRVQGVGFRYFTRSRAQACGLVGCVRNLPDGRVEVIAVGATAALQALLNDIRSGPAGSVVRDCRVEWLPEAGHFTEFRIEH